MRLFLIKFSFFLFLILINFPTFPATYTDNKTKKVVTVLLSADTSGLNLATALQYALANLFKNIDRFNVQLSSYILSGFSPADISLSHQALVSEILSFAYLEKQQISIFLFDKEFEGRFFVATEPLFVGGMTKITTPDIERKLQAAFVTLMRAYRNKNFQYLPGAIQQMELAESEDERIRRYNAEARQLFGEFALQESPPLYVGASIGMARFGESRSTDVVNVGASIGYWLNRSFSLELNANIFTYSLASFMLKYRLPISSKFVYFTSALGIGKIISNISENRGISSNLKTGQTLFGPNVCFEIPLLGANIRAEISFLAGNGLVIIGNYGVIYSIKL